MLEPVHYAHPFDDDKLREECGVFGVIGVADAASFVALGLHALQHRGQEAGGIVTYEPEGGFHQARRMGYVRDSFTSRDGDRHLPAHRHRPRPLLDHGRQGPAVIRNVQPFFGEFALGGAAIAHNGNLTNAAALRRELIERGSIFQSSSDTGMHIHLMARSMGRTLVDRMEDALRKVEGAFSSSP
jgi:amidophosphoribosyltransferase